MKKSMKFFGIIAVVVVIGFLAGCTTTNLKSNLAGEYNMIPKIAGKDFNVIGLVSVSATEKTVVTPLHLTKDITGERVTFDLLLQEAKKLYPDVSDIINVRIDRVDQSKRSVFDFFTGYDRTIQYFGNALAVKYTTALEEVRDPLKGKTGQLPDGESGGGLLGALGGLFDGLLGK